MSFLKRYALVIWIFIFAYPTWACVNNEAAKKKCELDCCCRYLNDTLFKVTCDLGCERCVILK